VGDPDRLVPPVIRRATAADAGPMAEVWLRSFSAALPTVRRPHGDDEVRAYFRDVLVPQQEAWVAVDDGEVVGLLALDGDFVSQLYVEPSRRRQGIGTALLAQAKRERPAGLRLWTFQVNTAAQAFYRRHGFVEVERTDGAGNQEREPDIRFEWHPG
jgi:ribosomal protein S18 acetylase RimI-like enzyme